MANETEIQALIQLLDDEDKEVFRHVHDKLLSLGEQIIPHLEEVWTGDLNPTTHERLEEIIHEIQFTTLTGEWEAWLQKENPDLLTGAFLVSKYYYPEIKYDVILRQMQKLRQSIWLELNYNQTPLEQVQVFNQVFYGYHEFKGLQNSENPKEFCLSNVIETKRGNAIAIGIIYQVIANDLNLPVYGVNLMRHYILAFCKKTILDFSAEMNNGKDVMFYVNPVNKGSIFSRNEIKDYLDKLHAEHEPKNFSPSGNVAIVKELLQYLIEISSREDQQQQLKDLNALFLMM